MQLALVVSIAALIWVGVLLLGISLCRATKTGDRAMEHGELNADKPHSEVDSSPEIDQRIDSDAMGVDLGPHPRPTRGVSKPAGALADDDSATAGRLLSVSEAADELGVSTEVLVAWEARFGYPKPHRSSRIEGTAYSRAEVLALAESLRNGLSIPSAVDDAQATTNRRRAAARRLLHDQHHSTPDGL